MLFAFLDESYTKDRYYMCAVVIDETAVRELARIRKVTLEFASEFGVDRNAELHAHAMMTGVEDWVAIRGQARSAIAIYRRALSLLATLPVRVFLEGVDVVRLNSRYRYPRPPHVVTFQHVLERVDGAARRSGTTATVIADEVPGQVSLIRRAAGYQANGTGGYLSSKLSNIEMPLKFASSKQSPGLQMADLVVYLHRRRDAHEETNPRTSAAVEDLWALLRPLRPSMHRWDP